MYVSLHDVVQSAPDLSQVMLSPRHALIYKTTKLARPRLSDTWHVSLIDHSAKELDAGI
jgi:hypothetical protein